MLVAAPYSIRMEIQKIKILLLEGISDTAVNALSAAGYTSVERLPKALEGEALRAALKGISMVGIRSRTRLTAAALDGIAPADNLRAFARESLARTY